MTKENQTPQGGGSVGIDIMQHDITNPHNYAKHEQNAVDLLLNIIHDARQQGTDNYTYDGIVSMLDSCTVEPSAVYHEPEAVLKLNGYPILSRGQFSDIIGLSGSRKSWFCYALASVFLSNRPSGFFSTPLQNAKVLYIDTEQGANMTARAISTIRSLTGQESPNIIAHSMRDIPSTQRWFSIAVAIERNRPDIVIIDGIADVLSSPNNEADSFAVQQFLMTFSARYNCHIVNVIHLAKNQADTKGTGGGRGHLGSNLNRKAEMEFHLAKDSHDANYTNISMPKDSRLSAPQPSFSMHIETVEIEPNKWVPLPEFCDSVDKPMTPKREGINETILQILRDAGKPMGRADIARKMQARLGGTEETQAKNIDKARKSGVIIQTNGGYKPAND